MDDLELIKLAGKAADIEYTLETNPLNDDALALRLAVRLKLNIEFFIFSKTIWCFKDTDGNTADADVFEETYDDDPYAATRRAIVRAAAEIGWGME